MKEFQQIAIAFFTCLVLVACKREKNPQDVVTLNSNTDTEKMIEEITGLGFTASLKI